MRFRYVSAIAAIAVLTATTFQFGAAPSAVAHGGGKVIPRHQIKTPPKVKAVAIDNVRDFGATGDGTTDDTTAIQNAANDASINQKGVFFPAGNYLHASPVTFNGVPVTGVGGGSVLIANDTANCAVILTGQNVSIQNIVISAQGLAGNTQIASPKTATLLVQNATSFTVANDTIVQGTNMWGVLIFTSTVGTVNSVVCDGTGSGNDIGVVIDQGANVTIANNLFQNEAVGILALGPSLFIALLSNTIGNVSFPTLGVGIKVANVNNFDVAQNTIQMLNSSGTLPVVVANCDNFSVANNNTFGGGIGISATSNGSGNNFVAQNTIRNCGVQGILISNSASSAIQVTSNQFGECGLFASGSSLDNAVVLVNGTSADASGATTFVQNNSYQGHINGLTSYVTCSFTSPHIPAANVTGNTQTQTALANNI
jgi:hypothetical protein